jgi:hypothetical protein
VGSDGGEAADGQLVHSGLIQSDRKVVGEMAGDRRHGAHHFKVGVPRFRAGTVKAGAFTYVDDTRGFATRHRRTSPCGRPSLRRSDAETRA